MYCQAYNALLARNAAATANYYAATTELVRSAGKQEGARFAEAERNCVACLRNCKRTAAAMRKHAALHRCTTVA